MASETIKRVRLGEVCSQVRGVSYKPRDARDDAADGYVPLLRANNISPIGLNHDELVYVRSECVNETQYVRRGDLLVCASSGSRHLVGKTAQVLSDAHETFGAFCKVVRPSAQFVEFGYLAHYFQSDVYRLTIASKAAGANINNIRSEHLNDLELPLPPLPVQRQIAAALDKISEMKRNAEARLQKLDLLVKARFSEMFGDVRTNSKGWRKERLESHVDVLTGFPFESAGYVESGGVRVCGGLIIMPGYVDWRGCRRWPGSQGVETFLLESGDIVMALDRPWVSAGFKIAQLKEKDLPALLVQRTARIRGLDVDQRFLLSLLEDKAFESHCTVTGSLVPHISHKDIKSYEMILPPLSLQRSFAAFVEKVEALKATAQASLARVDLLYRAKLQEYFG